MIRKLRIRFIVVATLSAAIVILAVSCGILLTNRRQTLQNIDGMLSLLAQNEGRFPEAPSSDASGDAAQDADGAKPVPPAPRGDRSPLRSPETPFRTRFFTAIADADGEILRLNTDNLASLSEAEARTYVTAALADGKTDGRTDVYYYRIAPDTEDGTRRVVVFLNCEVELAAMHALARICVLISVLSILLVTLLSFALSGAAIRPFVLNLARQKEFITGASHELKTPMTTIAGYLDGMLDGTIPQPEQRHYMELVSTEVRRLSRLVRNMLEISRLKDQGIPADKLADFDLCEAAGQALLSFEQRINRKHLNVDVDMPELGVTVRAMPDAVTQVLYNLIDNAVKFIDDGGTLSIRVERSGNKAVTTVGNTGPTIAPEELPLIFDRFHKTDKSRSTDRDGVGLGLYIVKTIVLAHGEDIYVTSRDGKTEFTFTLPLVL